MVALALSECTSALDADLAGDDITIRGVGIDTRSLQPGMLYVAIVGERFDGHDFVAEAEQAGATALLVHRDVASRLPQLHVADTRVALGALAGLWASRHPVQTIGITGSNGKTTIKEIVTAILSRLGPVLSTRGNFNNDIGVPLTLFRLTAEHRYAVIEMGASAAGEIASLAAICRPDVGVVGNVGPAHLEGFGSLENIAAAKSEMFASLDSEGYAVINADDDFAETFRAAAAHCRRREFGISGDVDVKGIAANDEEPEDLLVIESRGTRLQAKFDLMGAHNRMNALAAVAAVQCVDVSDDVIVDGLESVRAVAGRLERKRAASGATIIDDSYNANPASARVAIRVLSDLDLAASGRRHMVLGDMGELGDDALELHAAIGICARERGVNALWSVGALSRAAAGHYRDASAGDSASTGTGSDGGHFANVDALLRVLLPDVNSDDIVLVKGSRSAGMERVVHALEHAEATFAGTESGT